MGHEGEAVGRLAVPPVSDQLRHLSGVPVKSSPRAAGELGGRGRGRRVLLGSAQGATAGAAGRGLHAFGHAVSSFTSSAYSLSSVRPCSPFDRNSTAAQVIDGVDLSGKRAMVTGATPGIGVETAHALASAGADVTLAVRRPDAGEAVAADLRVRSGNDAIHIARLDVADLDSVNTFTADWSGPVHILVNNAGIMMLPELERGIRGQEQQFATNYLGHFALALGLHRALAEDGGARLVTVSSSGHLFSPVVFDDLDYRFRPYDPLGAYGQSKTAEVLLAVEADRRWSDEGIRANAHRRQKTPEPYRKTIEQGAATSVFLAASPLVEGIGGRYFEDVNEAPQVTARPTELGVPGVAAYALDAANAERLWNLSTTILS